MKIVAIALLLGAVALGVANAAERWTRSPSGEWVIIDSDHGRWQRAPTGPDNWRWVYPDEHWRLDPNGRWRVVPE